MYCIYMHDILNLVVLKKVNDSITIEKKIELWPYLQVLQIAHFLLVPSDIWHFYRRKSNFLK